MTKQINEAGKELVVDSIRILKGNGLTGAGAATIQRRLSQVEQSVTIIEGKQNDYWSGIGEDNIITPIEKLTLQKEKGIIDAEKPSMVSRAEAAGVSSMLVYDVYIQKYNLLNNMLNNLGIFDDMSANTEIADRDAFNLAYTEYYEARDNLQDAITKGYVSEGQGTLDRDAVPCMVLSANVVQTNLEHTIFNPSRIEMTGVITNGIYSDPYSCIFEIYRNGEETPSVKTGITKVYYYDIPAGTESLRIIQKNVEGKLVYDNEVIHIYNDRSEQALVVSNSYQTFINGTKTRADASQVDLTAAVKGYSNGYPRSVSNVTVTEAPSLRVTLDDNDVIHMTPEDEVLESGTIGITADIEDAQVIGIGDDLVLGIPELGIVIGQIPTVTMQTEIEYRNYDTLAFLELESEKVENETKSFYLGPIAEPQILQNVEYGQYFLYTGDDTTQFQKGSVYLWNGQRWVNDYNNEHNTVAMKDMFALLGTMPGLANEFINNLVASTAFIKQLFSEIITIRTNTTTGERGRIQSENYAPGEDGFYFDSNGQSELNNVTIRGIVSSTNAHISGQSTFEGDIFSGPLVLSSEESEGLLIESGVDYRTYWKNLKILEILESYSLIESHTSTRWDNIFITKKLKGEVPVSFSYFRLTSTESMSVGHQYYRNTVDFFDENWVNVLSVSGQNVLISFRPILLGSKTFKLIDIPTYPSSTPGVVWCDTNNGNILKLS